MSSYAPRLLHTIPLRQPGPGAHLRRMDGVALALEPADDPGMVRLFRQRDDRAQSDGRGAWELTPRRVTLEYARTVYGYRGVDSSG